MSNKKVTRVVVTVNNYTGEGYEAFKTWSVENCKYAVIGKEVGEKGTRHLQCFLILKKRVRLTTITKTIETVVGKHPFTASANGKNQEASDYCKKDGVFFEHGSYPAGRGARTDIKEFLDAVREGKDDDDLAKDHPNEYVKYYKAAQNLRGVRKQKRNRKRQREEYEDMPLRNWQRKIVDKLKEQNDRHVLWVYDQLGNLGKSWLANWLVVNHDAYLVEGGKTSDIAHAYNYQDMVVFDYTRSQEERVNYQVIESFKNGRIFAPKYESKMKIFKKCKVVCFSNFDPDRSKLSKDRWKVIEFKGPHRDHWMKMEPPKKKRKLNSGKPQINRQDCVVSCDCPQRHEGNCNCNN